MITAKMTLAEVVKQYPQTIPYLNDLHLDYCCGGHLPIDVYKRQIESLLLQTIKVRSCMYTAIPAPAVGRRSAYYSVWGIPM